eukprot:2570440-Prymnesium_polylepis.1
MQTRYFRTALREDYVTFDQTECDRVWAVGHTLSFEEVLKFRQTAPGGGPAQSHVRATPQDPRPPDAPPPACVGRR